MLDFTKALYTCNCQVKNEVGGKLWYIWWKMTKVSVNLLYIH